MAIDTMTTGQLIDVLEYDRVTTRQARVLLDELQQRANNGDDEANHFFACLWYHEEN